MKTIKSILFFLSFVFTQINAQNPEPIKSLTKVHLSSEYYDQQAKLWKKEVEKNSKNGEAWFNYYRASRYKIICSPDDTLRGNHRFYLLKNLIDEMEKEIPESFEFNYLKWLNGGNDLSLLPYLEKAYKINPNREETYPDFVSAYELLGRTEERNKFIKLWYQTGQVSPGYLNYNYNVLQSMEKNAIILTVGDNDTYPLWVLQEALNVRKDIKVINLSLLFDENYQNRKAQELNFKTIQPTHSKEEFKQYTEGIIESISKNGKGLPLYVGSTVDQRFTEKSADKLYLTGLVYIYSNEKPDHIALLKRNLESNYALDYLQMNFTPDPAGSSVNMANANYLVPMITLYEHYVISGEVEKAQKWRNKAEMVAKNCGREEEIISYFNKK